MASNILTKKLLLGNLVAVREIEAMYLWVCLKLEQSAGESRKVFESFERVEKVIDIHFNIRHSKGIPMCTTNRKRKKNQKHIGKSSVMRITYAFCYFLILFLTLIG